jgi:hypothetical protein
MKTCITCKQEKPKSEFYSRSSSADKLNYHCKECTRKKRNEYNSKRDPAVSRHYTLNRVAKLIGIPVEVTYQALKDQDYKCKICKVDESELPKKLCADHCHKTGKFRGMLCNRCNVGLANFRDNTEFLQIAIDYLKK